MGSREFLRALDAAGVIQQGDHVRRVVIDAELDQPVKVYVERWGDDRLLTVVPALTSVQVDDGFPPAGR